MRRPFSTVEGIAAPLDRADVDTDAIIPKQFMKSIERTGFGDYLFDNWRYLDPGEPGKPKAERTPNPEFILNQPRFSEATILLTRQNFGCGSSREHALWALVGYGFRSIIAPSFAEIFRGNCFKNGLLPIELPASEIAFLFDQINAGHVEKMLIDLRSQTVAVPNGPTYRFSIDVRAKRCMLEGLDDIDLTLLECQQIERYERDRRRLEPWLFGQRRES